MPNKVFNNGENVQRNESINYIVLGWEAHFKGYAAIIITMMF